MKRANDSPEDDKKTGLLISSYLLLRGEGQRHEKMEYEGRHKETKGA